MSHATIALEDLEGVALVAAIEQRFDTMEYDVSVGDRTLNILRPRNSDDLIREEDFVKDERLPYWADIWPASTILAAELIKTEGKGQRLLELGCGVGLVSTAALAAGYKVVGSDYYTDALAFTRANGFRNLRRSPEARMINWREFPSTENGYDFVVASDVLYEEEYARLMPHLFLTALKPGGTAIMADPGRIAAPIFLEQSKAAGFKLWSDDIFPFSAEGINQQITIYRLEKP